MKYRSFVFMLFLGLLSLKQIPVHATPSQCTLHQTTSDQKSQGDLQACIDAAQSYDIIELGEGIFMGPFMIENKNITIKGKVNEAGEILTVLDGAHANRVLSILGSSKVTLQHLIIQNGVADVGAGIFNSGEDLLIQDCRILYNEATDFGDSIEGGGAILTCGPIRIYNSKVMSNKAIKGGGIVIQGADDAVIAHCRIQDNDAGNSGGGVFIDTTGTVEIRHSVIKDNRVFGNGGGISCRNGKVELSHLEMKNNLARRGGAIFYQDGSLSIEDSKLIKNAVVNGIGGGIFYRTGLFFKFINLTIRDNLHLTEEAKIISSDDNIASGDIDEYL